MAAFLCVFVCLAGRLRRNDILDIDTSVDGKYNEENTTSFQHNSIIPTRSDIRS